MTDSEIGREEDSTKNTRRNLLKVAGVGITGLTAPGVVSADETRSNGPNADDHPGKGVGPNNPPRKGPKNISDKDPEEVFGEDITKMSNEEIEEKVEKLWDEGMGGDSGQVTLQTTKNCFSDSINLKNIPGIELDICLLDNECGVSVTAGVLGVTDTAKLKSCYTYCRTFTFNVVAEKIEMKLCYNHRASKLTASVERDYWRPCCGWRSNSGRDTIYL